MAIITRTAFKRFFLCFMGALGCAVISLVGQQPESRMVIGTNVVCRAGPERSARAVRSLRLGEIVFAIEETQAGGATWYLEGTRGFLRSCWVYGPLTADFERSNPEPALLAAVCGGYALQGDLNWLLRRVWSKVRGSRILRGPRTKLMAYQGLVRAKIRVPFWSL